MYCRVRNQIEGERSVPSARPPTEAIKPSAGVGRATRGNGGGGWGTRRGILAARRLEAVSASSLILNEEN